MLRLVRHRETELTSAITSFAAVCPVLVAQFDASLSGSELIWYAGSNGTEVAVGVSAVDLSFLGFRDDSSFQNLSEFLGAILAVLGQIVLGFSEQSVALRGDSVIALTWALTKRPRGRIVTKAAMVWSLLCTATGVDVKEIAHIPGVDNRNCDRLSRRRASPAMSIGDEAADMRFKGVGAIEMDGCPEIMDILMSCDPSNEMTTEGVTC